MRITIECTAAEEKDLPRLLSLDMPLGEIVRLAERERTVRKNKESLLRFQREVFNGHDWSLETLSRHLTEDFRDHAAMPGDSPGLEGVQARFSYWATAFADAEEENVEMVGEGDLVAVLYNLHARHAGDYLGVPATGADVVIPGIEFVRFRDGRICEHWGIYDFMTTAEEINADLVYAPRKQAEAPRRPELPWGPERKAEEPPPRRLDRQEVAERAERSVAPPAGG
jgi:predicted ester cyclase